MARNALAVETLGRNSRLVNRVTLAAENHMYGDLHHRACISEARQPEVIASRKTIFQVRYLRRKVRIGLNGSWSRVARTSYDHAWNAFGVFGTLQP